ncbi:MAG: hypothetical protein ACKVQS_07700 [Fimbriimonadaceae bacterium]
MATFQRDQNGNWVAVRSPVNANIMPYAYGSICLLGLSIALLLRPAIANTVPPLKATLVPKRSEIASPKEKSLIAPIYGKIKLGAFAGEAANLAGLTYISTTGLSNKKDYEKYRTSIRSTYGIDLEDMNYFSLAPKKLNHRLTHLKTWILMAGEYGDVTLAIEPLGASKYKVFDDKNVMAKMKSIFDAADKKGITVWVRFASESNLRGSEYSSVNNPNEFYEAAKKFKSQMPKNVKLVFSPLINTYIIGGETQKRLAQQMLYGPNDENKLWDRIGGTIYRTNRALVPMYRTFYQDMHELAPNTPFQICEVGCPYSQRDEVLDFLKSCSQGQFPALEKVNLFALNINRRADPSAEFGYLDPKNRAILIEKAIKSKLPQKLDSFLKPIILADN